MFFLNLCPKLHFVQAVLSNTISNNRAIIKRLHTLLWSRIRNSTISSVFRDLLKACSSSMSSAGRLPVERSIGGKYKHLFNFLSQNKMKQIPSLPSSSHITAYQPNTNYWCPISGSQQVNRLLHYQSASVIEIPFKNPRIMT